MLLVVVGILMGFLVLNTTPSSRLSFVEPNPMWCTYGSTLFGELSPEGGTSLPNSMMLLSFFNILTLALCCSVMALIAFGRRGKPTLPRTGLWMQANQRRSSCPLRALQIVIMAAMFLLGLCFRDGIDSPRCMRCSLQRRLSFCKPIGSVLLLGREVLPSVSIALFLILILISLAS